jgi:hypothetical protein
MEMNERLMDLLYLLLMAKRMGSFTRNWLRVKRKARGSKHL